MWIFTETGFVSAVQHRDNPDLLVVRGRDMLSLEPITNKFPELDITSNATSDYPHRIIMPKTKFNDWVGESITDLNYPNFKNQVAKVRGNAFAGLLGKVWGIMLGAEDEEARRVRAAYDRKHGFAEYR
jgi:hypothetical protein